MNDPNSDANPRGQLWAVHRIDDNGKQFLVKGTLSREEAERLIAEYEARGFVTRTPTQTDLLD
jgi:hypothetical protein